MQQSLALFGTNEEEKSQKKRSFLLILCYPLSCYTYYWELDCDGEYKNQRVASLDEALFI